MPLDVIAGQNPWWARSSWIADDPHLRELSTSPLSWEPRPIEGLRPGRIYTLRGPRQVGKTTAVKGMVSRLIGSGTDPRSVLFLSCELVATPEKLAAEIEEFLHWRPAGRTGVCWLLLDEVSSVRRWSSAVKWLHGRGAFRDAVVLLTGSHAIDVRRETERLPGRRGEGLADDPLDRALLPMNFREFVVARDPDRRSLAPARAGLLSLAAGKGPDDAVGRLLADGDALRGHFDDYLLCGGFPRPAAHLARGRRIPPEVYDQQVRAVVGDLVRWGGRDTAAREVLGAVLDTMTSRVGLRTLAAKTSIASPTTVAKYAEDLEATYALLSVPHFDPGRGRPVYRKERKLYVADPFLFHAFRAWCLGLDDPFSASEEFLSSPDRRGRVVEATVAAHLARGAPSMWGSPAPVVFHWRSGHGEVDFVLPVAGRRLGIQVTASRSPEGSAFAPLRAFREALVLTGGGASLSGKVPVIPATCFLAGWS